MEYYSYLWKNDRKLLLSTLFVNYGLPVVMESLPWYLTRSSLSKKLRDTRNALQHDVVLGRGLSLPRIVLYATMALLYAVLHSFDQLLRNRVDVANRLTVKRLVMERILYSEFGALQRRYYQLFYANEEPTARSTNADNVRQSGFRVSTEELETRVLSDLHLTLHFFNFILPAFVRGIVDLAWQLNSLYGQRHELELVTLLRPSVVGFFGEMFNELRLRLVEEKQVLAEQNISADMSRIVCNMVDGLAEVQVNNLQKYQLRQLDQVSVGLCVLCSFQVEFPYLAGHQA